MAVVNTFLPSLPAYLSTPASPSHPRDAGCAEAAIAALSTRLAPALADSAELRRLVYAGEPEAVQAFVESLRTLDNAPQQVFSHVLPTRRQQAVNRYVYQTEVVSADGTTYTYGNSVRNFDLRGKPYVQLDPELRALGFEQHIGVINGRDGAPVLDANGQTVRQVYYTHPDGGMVRIKPDGDPLSPKRKQPHVSKSVRYPHNGPFDDFFYERFKVDAYGKPLPRAPDDTFISFPPRTAEEGVALDDLMNQVHVYLPWGDQ